MKLFFLITLSILSISALAQVSSVNYEEVVLDDKPVAYWKLNDKSKAVAKDSAGQYNGLYCNVKQVDNLSPFLRNEPNAIFHQNAYVSIVKGIDEKTPKALREVESKSLTFEAWINSNPITEGFSIIFCRTGDYAFGLGYDAQSNEMRPGYLFAKDEKRCSGKNARAALSPNTWYHMVYVLNGTGPIEIYVNGALVLRYTDQENYSRNINPCGNEAVNLRIGSLQFLTDESSSYFQGIISHVALYDKALSSTVIEKHYLAGLAERNQVLNSGKTNEILVLESLNIREQAVIQKEKALEIEEQQLLKLQAKLKTETEELTAENNELKSLNSILLERANLLEEKLKILSEKNN